MQCQRAKLPSDRGVDREVSSDRLHMRSSVHWPRIYSSHDLICQYHRHIELSTPDKKSQTTISHTSQAVTRCRHCDVFRKYTSPSRHRLVKKVDNTHQLAHAILGYLFKIKFLFYQWHVGIPHLPFLGAFSRRLPYEFVELPAPPAHGNLCKTNVCSYPPPPTQTCRSQKRTPDVSLCNSAYYRLLCTLTNLSSSSKLPG